MTHARSAAVMAMPTASWDADAALEQMYAVHWRQLVRLAAMLVGDLGTAEEVVQDAFVSMHSRWRRLNDPDRALAYLRQSVVNGARSVLRHRTVVTRHLAREPRPREAAPADDRLGELDRRRAVLEALSRLPQRQREVIVLRHYLEMSGPEIAAALGISTGAVKSHASRGAAALRDHLSDLWEERS